MHPLREDDLLAPLGAVRLHHADPAERLVEAPGDLGLDLPALAEHRSNGAERVPHAAAEDQEHHQRHDATLDRHREPPRHLTHGLGIGVAQEGNEQRALAGAICAYAANIDNLDGDAPGPELLLPSQFLLCQRDPSALQIEVIVELANLGRVLGHDDDREKSMREQL